MSIASNLDLDLSVQLANISAMISIEKLGCVQVSLQEIARRLLELDIGSKIYDEDHTYLLRQVLKDKFYTLLVLMPREEISRSLFKTIQSLTKKGDRELIIYVQASPGDEFVEFLATLSKVNFIIMQKESLDHLLETMHPEEIFFFERDKKELLSNLLSRFADHSTTKAKISLIKND
jgi:hypothetical protein